MGIMNKFECIISCLIVGVIALALVFKAVGMAVKYIVNTCADVAGQVVGFFGLAPGVFWSLAIMIFVTTGLIWAALRIYYSIVKMRNETSIVEVNSKRAFICRDGDLTAVSFEGDPITTQRIGSAPKQLADAEIRILRRREDERRRIEYRSYNGPIPGCHH
jgi:predicted membrane protein